MSKYPYSMEGAIGYSIVLLVSLWWLPVVGPIIIGYITGRKAGGPVKGLIAMAIPIFLYFSLMHLIAIGWVHVPHLLKSYFTTSVESGVILPYMKETFSTGIAISANIVNYLYYVPSSFFIMLSFAFIGGAMSRQIILERGIYTQPKISKPVKKVDVKKSGVVEKKTAQRPKDVERDGKFVVHKMDTKKKVPVKKKYGITFL